MAGQCPQFCASGTMKVPSNLYRRPVPWSSGNLDRFDATERHVPACRRRLSLPPSRSIDELQREEKAIPITCCTRRISQSYPPSSGAAPTKITSPQAWFLPLAYV